MMTVKQWMNSRETKAKQIRERNRRASLMLPPGVTEGIWRPRVIVTQGSERPWDAAANGKLVLYVDGSWSFLHAAQQHILSEAARRADHLVVGVHDDDVIREMVGSSPPESYAERLERLKNHRKVSSILTCAPWAIKRDLVQQLGIARVVTGTVTKVQDCRVRPEKAARMPDPYGECKQLGVYDEIESLDESTELSVLER